ncbi:MAG: hypothetical protein WBD40_02650, partial [Tepidisphaeraceae bacterium]
MGHPLPPNGCADATRLVILSPHVAAPHPRVTKKGDREGRECAKTIAKNGMGSASRAVLRAFAPFAVAFHFFRAGTPKDL